MKKASEMDNERLVQAQCKEIRKKTIKIIFFLTSVSIRGHERPFYQEDMRTQVKSFTNSQY